MKQLLQIILYMTLIGCTLFGQTDNTWNGEGDNFSWDDPDNWSENAVPNEDHNVIINIACYIETAFDEYANHILLNHDDAELVIGEGSTLTVDESDPSEIKLDKGTISNYGDLYIQRFKSKFNSPSTFTNHAGATMSVTFNGNDHNFDKIQMGRLTTFINHGTINADCNDEDLDAIFCDGTLDNYGTINVTGEFSRGLAIYITGVVTNESGGVINGSRTNSGGVNGSIIWPGNEFINHGTVNIEHPTDPNGTMTGHGISTSTSAVLENTGTINIANMEGYAIWFNIDWNNTGDLNLGSTNGSLIGNSPNFPRELNNASGTISGSGIINIGNNLVGGTLNIGDSPGEVTFQVNQDMTTVYAPIEIAGTAGPGDPNGHDVIYGQRVNDTYDLVDIELGDADLDIYLLGGFQPVYGDEFLIVKTDGELTGNYGIIGFPSLDDPNLYWEMDYDFVNDEVWFVVNAFVVPVELASFEAIKRGEDHQLNWTTASEINSSHFEIQTSQNATDWQVVGRVEASRNSSTYNDYSYDYKPQIQNEVYYYRLKIIDLDGSFEYSEVRSIRESITRDLFAYPNPFTDEVSISSTSGFTLYDTYGKVISTSDEPSVQIDLTDQPSGFYVIQYHGSTQKTEKIIKL